MDEMIKSKGFKIATLSVAAFLIVLVSFIGGVKVGSHRALFSCHWGENYERNFMGSRPPMGGRPEYTGPMMGNFERDDFRNAHGLSGEIVSVVDNKLIIKGRDGKENTAAVTEKTIIKNRSNDLKISELKTGDRIVVMGRPNDSGVVDADIIRVFENFPLGEENNNQPNQNNNQ